MTKAKKTKKPSPLDDHTALGDDIVLQALTDASVDHDAHKLHFGGGAGDRARTEEGDHPPPKTGSHSNATSVARSAILPAHAGTNDR